MKLSDIKEVIYSKVCFGLTIEINGKDIEEYDTEEVVELISDILINNDNIIPDVLETILDGSNMEREELYFESCETCGDFNYSTKFKNNAEENN